MNKKNKREMREKEKKRKKEKKKGRIKKKKKKEGNIGKNEANEEILSRQLRKRWCEEESHFSQFNRQIPQICRVGLTRNRRTFAVARRRWE